MNVLDELRGLDPGNPGKWSTRASLVVACGVFVLVSFLGIQLRIRGHVLPQLQRATASMPELQQRLTTARDESRELAALQTENEHLDQELRRLGIHFPHSLEELDLTVALSTGQSDSPLTSVQPWQPARELDRPLQKTGAELEIQGGYGETLNFLGFALGSRNLRELVEISIEPDAGENGGELRTTAHLLAYYGGEQMNHPPQATGPESELQETALLPPPPTDLRSPFGSVAPSNRQEFLPDPEESIQTTARGGLIQVGMRRYKVMQGPSGNMRLVRDGS